MENQQKIASIIKPDMPQSDMTRFIVVGVAFLIVILEIAFLGWLVPGKFNVINENNSKISQLTAETTELTRVLGVLNSTDSTNLKNDLASVEYALPSEKSVAGLVSGLTSLASSSGATVSKIEVTFGKISTSSARAKKLSAGSVDSDVKLSSDVVGSPISMEVTGSASQILELIAKIQQAMPLLGTQSMEYSFSEEGNSGKLAILVYSQPAAKFNMDNLSGVTPLSEVENESISSLSERTNILQ